MTEKPVPLRTDTVGDSQMDTMVLIANMVLSAPDKFPPPEVLQARDICRLVSTVRAVRAWAEDEQQKRHAAEDARVEARSAEAHLRLALEGIASDVRAKGCEACAEKEQMARVALGGAA